MLINDLPTNDGWTDYGWTNVFPDAGYHEGTVSVPDNQTAADVTADRIARVDRWDATSADGMGDVNFVALMELVDGTWAACTALTDTTGWGCQQTVVWRVAATRDDVIRFGLDRDGRRRLNVALDVDD